MIISDNLCIGCGMCIEVCPGEAIQLRSKSDKASGQVASVDHDMCFECGVCMRWDNCPTEAMQEEPVSWPRSVRRMFSDPTTTFTETTVSGRGTEEMKTNEITHRFLPGVVGLSIDVGRPNKGARLRDVDTITRALAAVDVQFSPDNPVFTLMTDPEKGCLSGDIVDERVLSAVVECSTTPEQLPEALRQLQKVSAEVDTVFSVGLIANVDEMQSCEDLRRVLRDWGVDAKNSAKINVGLGRR